MTMQDATVQPCAKKLGFESNKQARAAAIVAELQHGTKLKTYHCRYCKLWHLSTEYSTE